MKDQVLIKSLESHTKKKEFFLDIDLEYSNKFKNFMNEIYIRDYYIEAGLFELEFTNKHGEFYSCKDFCIKEFVKTNINDSVDRISFKGGIYLPYETSEPVRVWRKVKSSQVFRDGKMINLPVAISILSNLIDEKVIGHPAPKEITEHFRSLLEPSH